MLSYLIFSSFLPLDKTPSSLSTLRPSKVYRMGFRLNLINSLRHLTDPSLKFTWGQKVHDFYEIFILRCPCVILASNCSDFYCATACNATHGIARPFCLSACLSVKLADCDKTKETCAHILIPHERSFILVFWHGTIYDVNRKSHTSFRLVPTSVTLNNLERRNSPYFALFRQVAFQTDYVTVIEDRPIMSAKYRLLVTFGQNWPTQQ